MTAASAALWSAVFALVHLYWALGGTVALGLPPGETIHDRPLLFAVDLAAIPACLAAAVLAVRLGGARGRGATAAGWFVALLCLAHSGPSLAATLVALATGEAPALTPPLRIARYLYDPWWCAGGLLFAAAASRAGPTRPGKRTA